MVIGNQDEQWLGLVGCPGYEVSSLGRVRTYRYRGRAKELAETPRVMAPATQKKGGYAFVVLRVNGKRRNFFVHQLVLTAFVGPRPPATEGERIEGCHFPDRCRTNNRIDNLRWGTSKENSQDSKIHGTNALCGARGESHHDAKLTDSKVREIIRLRQEGRTLASLAKDYGVSYHAIYMVVKRLTWKHLSA